MAPANLQTYSNQFQDPGRGWCFIFPLWVVTSQAADLVPAPGARSHGDSELVLVKVAAGWVQVFTRRGLGKLQARERRVKYFDIAHVGHSKLSMGTRYVKNYGKLSFLNCRNSTNRARMRLPFIAIDEGIYPADLFHSLDWCFVNCFPSKYRSIGLGCQ